MPIPSTLQRRQRYTEAWTGRGSYGTTLLVMFIDTYGTEGVAWHPTTIKMEIERDFGLELPQANHDRLMAAINILTGDDFFQSLPDFVTFCNILSGDLYDPRSWDPADAFEVAWGVTESMLIEPPDTDEPFADDIRAYIGAVLDAEGIMNPPDVLQLAVRSNNPQELVQGEFSDDPIMFDAINDFEQSKTQEINNGIRRSLTALSQQLESLPVSSGSTAEVVENMLRSLS